MEYIVSRSFTLPATAEEFQVAFHFNLWSKKLWPYERVDAGDVFYWYEAPSKAIVWKTRTVRVHRFAYESKAHLRELLRARFGDFDESQPYVVNAPAHGYCLAYKSQPLQRLNLPKPDDFRFPQLGWLSVEDQHAQEWLSQIDASRKRSSKIASHSSYSEGGVREITTELQKRDPRLRRDALKEYGYSCQVCGFDFGDFYGELGQGYIEVHHLSPLSEQKGERSTSVHDVAVVCANCHRVLHRNGSKPISLDELRTVIERQKAQRSS